MIEELNEEGKELLMFFKGRPLPELPIQLGPGERISDVKLFLNSHFRILRRDPESQEYESCLERLRKLKKIVIKWEELENEHGHD